MMRQELMILLILLGICDLWNQRLPVILLMIFSALALWQFCCEPFWTQVMAFLFSLFIIAAGLLLHRKGRMGGGDVWVMSVLALIWPMEIFWRSIFNGLLLLSLAAAAIWIYTKDEKERVPLVPFLILGYWAGG